MSISLDAEEATQTGERKMKKPKRANARVVASAGNTKVETANDNDDDDAAAATPAHPFIISSSSKTIVHSILTLFATYDRISTQHKIDGADVVTHDIASSHIKMDFKLKLVKRDKRVHEIAIVERNDAPSKGIACTSLRDFMDSRTTAVSYQRVLRMAEMIYEQMTALEAQGMAPPYYGLDDILVINESFFCFINDAKLFHIENASEPMTSGSNTRIHVTRAISRTFAFFAPELIGGISALPYSADVRSSYYSYGLLVAYCATFNSKLLTTHENHKEEEKENEKEKEDKEEEEEEAKGEEVKELEQSGGKRQRKHDNKNNKHDKLRGEHQNESRERDTHRPITSNALLRALEPLQYTKLYWLILRCCDPDVSRRSIIYV